MITQTLNASSERWREELRDVIVDPAELLRELKIDDPTLLDEAVRAALSFPLRAPRAFVKRIRPNDPADPLLRQLLPASPEYLHDGFGSDDPLEEMRALAMPGLLHKYRDRALLLTTAVCAGHCRYCFRREFPYQAEKLRAHQGKALDYIAAHPEIKEIILSGGDPLCESDERLGALSQSLDSIGHLKRLRVHTRTPIFVPSRVTDSLCALLRQSRLKAIVVIHCNHANEIDAEVRQALGRLGTACTLLNQSVLLRGVNDNADTLVALSERLFECGVSPYYLHIADAVRGSADFQVDETTGQKLLGQVATRLPGYLVPRLVKECPGKAAKTSLGYLLP